VQTVAMNAALVPTSERLAAPQEGIAIVRLGFVSGVIDHRQSAMLAAGVATLFDGRFSCD